MSLDERLERHMHLSQKVLERLKREGSWPWPDSQISADLIESKCNDIDA